MDFNQFDFITWFFDLGNFMQTLFGVCSLYGIYAFLRDWMPKRIKLSIGSFTIKRRYFDVQSITNIVSEYYYDGGTVPGDVRKEILHITNPKITKLIK